jgi:hypothetical protein
MVVLFWEIGDCGHGCYVKCCNRALFVRSEREDRREWPVGEKENKIQNAGTTKY